MTEPDEKHVILGIYESEDDTIYKRPKACIDPLNENIIHVCSFYYKYQNCVNGYNCFKRYAEIIGG